MRDLHIEATDWEGYPSLDLDLTNVHEVAITGLNNHGKSALLDALLWCLAARVGRDIDQRSADVLIRRHGSGMTRVVVSFTTSDSHTIRVTREKALGSAMTLDVEVDGVSRKGHTLDMTQAVIDEWVGLPYSALVASAFMVQGEAGLIDLRPRDAKDLIIELSGAQEYEPLYKVADARAKQADGAGKAAALLLPGLEEKVANADAVEAERTAAVQAVADAKAALDTANADLTNQRTALAAATTQAEAFDAADARLKRATDSVAAAGRRIEGLESTRPVLTVAAGEAAPIVEIPRLVEAAQVATASERLAGARQVRELHTAAVASQTRLSDRLTAALERRAILPTVPCHGEGEFAACQFLTSVPSEQAVEELKAQVAAIDLTEPPTTEAIVALEADWKDLDTANRAYLAAMSNRELARSNWTLRVENAGAQLATLDERIAGERDRQAADQAEVDRVTQELDTLTEAKAAALRHAQLVTDQEAAVKAAKQVVEWAEDRLHAAQVEYGYLAQAREQVEQVRASVAAAQADLDLYGTLARAWHRDGVPTNIIESVIPDIETRANEVLSRLPEDLTVELRTTRATKTQSGIQDVLNIVVTVDGDESPAALISVGARFRVNLALRIALAEVLTRRSGRRIETLWLDEPLADLDAPSTEAMVETLNTLAEDFALIVIVSHHPAFHEQIPARIRVEKVAGISTAELVA